MAEQSSAMKLISHVWSHKQEGTPHSWQRINSAMRASVKLAITAGLKFAKSDFEHIAETMDIVHWENAEGWYGMAIEFDNAGAVASIEKWKDRKPFLIEAKMCARERPSKSRMRLCVGSNFYWKDQCVTVTSFAQSHVVACAYKGGGYPRKIAKRFKINHEDIAVYHAELRAAERQAKEEAA